MCRTAAKTGLMSVTESDSTSVRGNELFSTLSVDVSGFILSLTMRSEDDEGRSNDDLFLSVVLNHLNDTNRVMSLSVVLKTNASAANDAEIS